ncbi:MAG: hypothetical protein JO297_06580 [Nitrososphaeraceae archaeon]|nr:hypothetical protein [Nitrososphaeraceae archaeon]
MTKSFQKFMLMKEVPDDFRASATNLDSSYTFSRGHNNEYATIDYTNWC